MDDASLQITVRTDANTKNPELVDVKVVDKANNAMAKKSENPFVFTVPKNLVEFTATARLRVEGRLLFELIIHARDFEQIPVMIFNNAFHPGIVVARSKGKYRIGKTNEINTYSLIDENRKSDEAFLWEELSDFTEDDWQFFAAWGGLTSLVKRVIQSNQTVGKDFMDKMFDEMEKNGEWTRTYYIDTFAYLLTPSLFSASQLFLPSPGDNFRQAKSYTDMMVDGVIKGDPLEGAQGFFGMVSYAILTVLDFVPLLGKIDDGVRATRKLITGAIETETKNLRYLEKVAGAAKPSEALTRGLAEAKTNIQNLQKLEKELDALSSADRVRVYRMVTAFEDSRQVVRAKNVEQLTQITKEWKLSDASKATEAWLTVQNEQLKGKILPEFTLTDTDRAVIGLDGSEAKPIGPYGVMSSGPTTKNLWVFDHYKGGGIPSASIEREIDILADWHDPVFDAEANKIIYVLESDQAAKQAAKDVETAAKNGAPYGRKIIIASKGTEEGVQKLKFAKIIDYATEILSKEDAARELSQAVERANMSSVVDVSERSMLDAVNSRGPLTKESINRFVRNLQAFYGEEGKTAAQKIAGTIMDLKDMGARGKVAEAAVTTFGGSAVQDLNKLKPNFEIVDISVGSKQSGEILSIATGREGRLTDKVMVLFDVEIDAAGNLSRANRPKFNAMMRSLVGNGYLKPPGDYDEFVSRARLLVPNHSADPLRAVVMERVKDPTLREKMVKAITSEISIEN